MADVNIIDAIKALAIKFKGSGTVADITADSIADAIIAAKDNYSDTAGGQATEETLGGVKAAEKGSGDTIEAKIDTASGKLYVAPTAITQATDSALGGVKASAKDVDDTVEAKIDSESGKLYIKPSAMDQFIVEVAGGVVASAPAVGAAGDLYFDTTEHKMYEVVSEAWVETTVSSGKFYHDSANDLLYRYDETDYMILL